MDIVDDELIAMNFFLPTAAGASTNPALDHYAGLGPFSEPESRTLSTFIESIGDKIDMYLSFHSFGHMLLLPFGNTTEPLANYEDAVSFLFIYLSIFSPST